MRLVLFIVFFSLLLIFLVKLCYKINTTTETFDNKEKEKTPVVKRPFVNLYDNLGNRLNVILVSKPFSGDAQITGAESTATGTPDTAYSSALNNTSFTAGYANPEMQPDSGDVIYIENRKPISRASDQTEDIKLIVEF